MENKKRAIYAEDLLRTIRDDQHIRGSAFARVKQHIDDAATVEDVEVVHGRWIKGKYPGEFTCSWCGMEYSEADPADKPFNYCPECGSKNE